MASPRLRPTQALPEKLAHRLNLYTLAATAAGVGLTTCAAPSQAKIIYTPAHRTLPINQIFNLDLNHDGITDFSLSATHSTPSGSGIRVEGGAFLLPPKAGNAVMGVKRARSFGSYLYASALKARARVGPGSPFIQDSKSTIVMGQKLSSSHQGQLSYGFWNNYGKGVKNRYLGFKFRIKGKVHYGWARLNFQMISYYPDVTLTGYAYETTPNKAIISGKRKANNTPNGSPGNLGHLALGAVTQPHK